MATQYTTILKLALPVQGELSGTWGDVVNDNITEMVEEAVAGRKVINTWTANSHALTTADGTTSESRAAILTLTDTGTALTGAGTVVCPANSKVYIVENGAGQTITVKTSSGTGVAVPNGANMVVFCDGTNVEQGITNINNLNVTGVITTDGMTTSADINFGDNDKAIFGAGNDLSIFHDGSSSVIRDSGTGNLAIQAEDFAVQSADASATHIFVDASSGYTALNYGGSTKLNTSSTGIDVTGSVTVDNTAGSPDQTLMLFQADMGTNDRNFQIKSPATDSASEPFRFTTANAFAFEIDANDSALVIASSANVGIGTSSPYRTLTVSGDQVVEGLLEVAAATPQILFSVPSGGLDSRIHNDGSGNFIFGTGTNSATPTERMRITSAGNVQIGTAAVTGGRYFDIYNTGSTATDFAITRFITQQVGSSSTTSADIYKRKNGEFGFANNDTDSAAYINFKVGASERMRIDSSGNVGIGTSAPGYNLDVQSAGDAEFRLRTTGTGSGDHTIARFQIAGTTASNYIYFGDADDVNSGMIRYVHSDDSMRMYVKDQEKLRFISNQTLFFNGATEVARFNSSNNVGIGVSSPAKKLDVGAIAYSSNQSGGIRIADTGGNWDMGVSARSDGSGQPRLSLDDGSGNETLSVYSSKVGIGTVTFTDNYKTIIDGSDQETANLTDAGTHGATLFLRATGEGVGSGGAVAFGTTFGNQRPFAAIKGLALDGTANSAGDLAFSTRASTSATALTERMRLRNDGRLGLGTDNPSAKFHTVADSQYGEAARFQNNGDAVGWARADWINDQASGAGIIYRDQAGSFVFRNDNSSGTAMTTRIVAGGTTAGHIAFNTTSSSEAMRVESSGEVGIGTPTPSAKLHVYTASTNNIIKSHSGSGYAAFQALSSGTNPVYMFFNNATGERGRITVTNSGEMLFYRAGTLENARFTSTGVLRLEKSLAEHSTALSGSGTVPINYRLGNNFTHTLSGNTTYTFVAPEASGYVSAITLKVTQDSTARTITWPSSVDWAGGTAPTLSTGSGDVDVFVFVTYDGGTTYYGFTAGQDMS